MHDLHVFLSYTLLKWCDNISVIALVSNPNFHARTKYVEVDYHYIHDKVVCKEIDVCYASTHDQVADIFTKGHTSATFQKTKSQVNGLVAAHQLEGGILTMQAMYQ